MQILALTKILRINYRANILHINYIVLNKHNRLHSKRIVPEDARNSKERVDLQIQKMTSQEYQNQTE